MQQVFVELFNYTDRWRALSPAQREEFVAGIQAAVNGLVADGVEVVGWGFNDPDTDRRAPYDFFCVYRTPSAEFQRGFEAAITGSGWHDYFDQVAVSGATSTPEALLAAYARLDRPASQLVA